jgi:D-glycero-beta-D-manno-heptose-7-phosphate kinase
MRYQELIAKFGARKVFVAGDVILDEFVWGHVSRISPEAPVPIVEVTSESFCPGGAANVARNLREFAGQVGVMGLLGADASGDRLLELLRDARIDVDSLVCDQAASTIVKTRIIAQHQQVVRVDRERRVGVSAAVLAAALSRLEKVVPQVDAIVIADYAKGFLRQEMADAICDLARKAGKPVVVDPSPANPVEWKGVKAIKPNRREAFAMAGMPYAMPVEPAERDEALLEVGRRLLQKWSAELVLITLGEQGLMLFQRGEAPYHTPTRARDVFDVSGAGDTVIALFTLALSAGAEPWEAAEIANRASGIVVGKLGTATVSPAELLASFVDHGTAEQNSSR